MVSTSNYPFNSWQILHDKKTLKFVQEKLYFLHKKYQSTFVQGKLYYCTRRSIHFWKYLGIHDKKINLLGTSGHLRASEDKLARIR